MEEYESIVLRIFALFSLAGGFLMDYIPEKICSVTYHLDFTPIYSSLALANQNGVPRFEPAFCVPLLVVVISDSFEDVRFLAMGALWQFNSICSELRLPAIYRFLTFRFFSGSVSSQFLGSEFDCSVSQNHRIHRHKLSKLLLLLIPKKNPTLYFKTVHAKVIASGFEANTFLNNILMSVYSKSGHWRYACSLFDRMTLRNLISWSTMISVYVQHGLNEEALTLFLEFTRSCNVNPNEFILATVVRACTQVSNAAMGKQVHSSVLKAGFNQHVYVANFLIEFYFRVGSIDSAKVVFDDLFLKEVVTWTTMTMGYVKCGRRISALQLFSDTMRSDIVPPDTYVISSVLAACSAPEFLICGKQIHAYILRRDIEKEISVNNVLVDFYNKCGKVKNGRTVFDQMLVKNVISWTTMISGYMLCSFHWDALDIFSEMSKLGLRPDGYACSGILTSCSSLVALEQGRQVHAYALKLNLDSDEFVQTGLIDMYSKCSSLVDARRVFRSMTDSSVISYNAIIEAYSRHGMLYEALNLFNKMRLSMIPPSSLTNVSILGVSASLIAVVMELSKQLHALIMKCGFCLDTFIGSVLIDVYSKCSFVRDAKLVFDEMAWKDIVVWNAMISGYVQQSENEEAFRLYLELQISGLNANEYTFVALLTASSNLASLIHGLQIHSQVIKTGMDSDPYVTNALLDMYAKCGSVKDARKLFDSASVTDLACWNAIITTYSQHGEAQEAINMFEEMIKTGTKPNYISFVGVLSACSHAGLVEEGFRYFNSMSSSGIEPGTEHYACLVSLLGTSGKLCEAREFIETMPRQPAAAMLWRSLLSACRLAGDVEMAEQAAEMAISIDPKYSGSYTLLSNIFASRGMWSDVKKVREKMEKNGIVKEAGCSWIEMNNEVHLFVARNRTDNESDFIYSIMDSLDQHIRGDYSLLKIRTVKF